MNTESLESRNIWNALNEWGQSLPRWQRFIVSHAVRDGRLSDERANEATRLFLIDAGLYEDSKPVPNIPDSVTGRQQSGALDPLVLREIKSLENVNAIPESSSLTFGQGLTVIYGHNGTGKSGFARVLSSACFSRSDQEIIGNIYDEQTSDAIASADICIEIGSGKVETLAYSVGDEHESLQRISVFDALVARIHLTKENTLGFHPAGFDVFDETVRVMALIGAALEHQIVAKTKPNNFGRLFLEDGPLSRELKELSAETETAKLRAKCHFGPAELARLEEVARQAKEVASGSPVETLRRLAAAKGQIQAIRNEIGKLVSALGKHACNDSRLMLEKLKVALQSANESGAAIVQHAGLVRTGTADWENFVDASRTLGQAESDTYPEVGDPCLLCHRPLDEPTASLIRRMWGFLGSDARIAAQQANEGINRHIQCLEALTTDLLAEGSQIRSELTKLVPDLVSDIDKFSASLVKRRDTMVKALRQGNIAAMPEGEIASPDAPLSKALGSIEQKEKALADGNFDAVVATLRAEHIDLRQRQVLGKNIEEVAQFIADLKWVEKAKRIAQPRLNTIGVTARRQALFRELVEGIYKSRLEEECRQLDCELPVEFKARGMAGKTLRGLRALGGHQPNKIFSEGEQRALALADFLTEVNLNPASAAIVLDDPVTSLDHRRKKKIAQRLANEARVRQVVVFTHDLVFLAHLLQFANESSISLDTHWVVRLDGVPGIVKLNESPANADAYKTPHRAEQFLVAAKKTTGQKRVDFLRSGAGALRATLEEIVLRNVFKGTIRRWDEHIRVNNLREVSWSNDVVDDIMELHSELSRLLEGHSHSDEFSGEMPEVDELKQMIVEVRDLQSKAKQKRK